MFDLSFKYVSIRKLCRVPCVPYAYTHAFVQSLRRVSLMREVFVLGRIKFIGQLLSSAKQQCSKMLCENLFFFNAYDLMGFAVSFCSS